MSNLLKEAIADAKTVRETAIANAKMALEEAFTPHLKSMLSAKLAEDEVEEGFDEITAEEMDDEEDEEDEEVDEMGGKSYREDDDEEMDMGDDEEDVDEGIIEINGVKYAPVVEGEHEEEDPEEGYHKREDDDEEMETEDLDLEAVIKELETEIAEAEESDEDLAEGAHEDDEDDKKDESVDEEIVVEEEDDDDEDKVDEQSKSSGIGAGDNKVTMASAADEDDPGKGKMKESVEKLQGELNEYKEAVTYLRDKLHEVNILNAKLLYTNRLFKEYVLSNDQKLKIVETFDRAQTTREIKLVYTTLAESFRDNGNEKKEVVKESYASKKSGGTAPKTKIITEESQVADRFRKLAGLKS